MSEQLKHIFDSSACLSKRQLKDYVIGTMSREECYALEHHVNTCFFCSEALDGMTEHSEALVTVDQLNTSFLKDHFSLTNPQIHLNSLAPAAAAPAMHKRSRSKSKVQPLLLKPSSIAAAILLGLGVLWYLDFGKNGFKPKQMAAETAATTNEHVAGDAGAVAAARSAVDAAGPASTESASQGIMSQQNGQSPMNDEPQKVQPLIINDGNSNSDAKAKELTAKEGNVPAQEVAAKKTTADEHKDVGSTITLPTPKVEKLPASPTSGASNLKAGVPAKNNESPVFTNTRRSQEEGTADKKEKEKNSKEDEGDGKQLAPAKSQYEAGSYGAAATSDEAQISNSDKKTSQQAALMSAKSYLKLGQKEKAKKLLQTLAEEGSGSHKRQAKRMLSDIED